MRLINGVTNRTILYRYRTRNNIVIFLNGLLSQWDIFLIVRVYGRFVFMFFYRSLQFAVAFQVRLAIALILHWRLLLTSEDVACTFNLILPDYFLCLIWHDVVIIIIGCNSGKRSECTQWQW